MAKRKREEHIFGAGDNPPPIEENGVWFDVLHSMAGALLLVPKTLYALLFQAVMWVRRYSMGLVLWVTLVVMAGGLWTAAFALQDIAEELRTIVVRVVMP
jgi:hypothetical protein